MSQKRGSHQGFMGQMRRTKILLWGGLCLFLTPGFCFGADNLPPVLHGSAVKQVEDRTPPLYHGRPYAPQNPRVLKGDRLSAGYDLQAAEAQYRKALKRNSKDAGAHNGLGKVYYQRSTSSNQAIRENTDALYEKAIGEFLTALRYQPRYVEAHLNLGTVYLEQGRLRDAEEAFERAYALAPRQSETNEKMGVLALNKGEVNQALGYLQKAIARNTKNSSAYYHLGAAYTARGEYTKALEALQTSLYLYPNSAPVHYQMGVVYELQGNGAAAINEFKKALVQKPEYLEPALKLVNHYQKRGDLALALDQLKSAYEAYPENDALAYRIGELSLQAQQPDVAKQYYLALLDRKPEDPKAQEGLSKSDLLLAQTHALLGDLSSRAEAQGFVDGALASDPDNLKAKLLQIKLSGGGPQVYAETEAGTVQAVLKQTAYTPNETLRKGALLLTQGQFDRAEQSFRNLLLTAKPAEELVTLGEIYLTLGDPAMAQEAFRHVLAQNTTQRAAVLGLQDAETAQAESRVKVLEAERFAKRQDSDQAIYLLKQALHLDQKNAEAHKRLAQRYEQEGQDRLAIHHYQAYLNLEPASRETHQIEAKIRRLSSPK